MNFDFPRVIRPIKLAEYAEEFGEREIRVWVNVPRPLMARMRTLKDAKDPEIFGWYSEIWGAGCAADDPEGWPVGDVEKLWDYCRENDPALWAWVTGKTMRMIFEYQAGIKKGWMPQLGS